MESTDTANHGVMFLLNIFSLQQFVTQVSGAGDFVLNGCRWLNSWKEPLGSF